MQERLQLIGMHILQVLDHLVGAAEVLVGGEFVGHHDTAQSGLKRRIAGHGAFDHGHTPTRRNADGLAGHKPAIRGWHAHSGFLHDMQADPFLETEMDEQGLGLLVGQERQSPDFDIEFGHFRQQGAGNRR